MNYIEPAGAGEAVLEALTYQTNLPQDQAIKIARIWESLRSEAAKHQGHEVWHRVVQLEEAASVALVELNNKVTDTQIKFLSTYSAVPTAEIDGYDQFEQTFKSFSMSEIGTRVMFAIIRSIEINEFGTARLNLTRLKTSVMDGSIQVEEEQTPQERMAARAAWVLQAIFFADFQNLLENEKTQVKAISNLADDQLTPEILMFLEGLLIRVQPNVEYFSSNEGIEKLRANYAKEIKKSIEQVKEKQFAGLSPMDIEYLTEVESRPEDEITPVMLANTFKLAAKVLWAQ